MATLGEPLVDLGVLLNYWPDPSDVDGARPLHVPGLEAMGLPTRAEVVARYAERTGMDVSAVPWFEAFATWKTCVVLEQLYQRFVRGESTDPRMGERGTPVGPLSDRAALLLDRLEPERAQRRRAGSLPLDDVAEVAVPVGAVDRGQPVDVRQHRCAGACPRRRR